jgi:hypothetical protein
MAINKTKRQILVCKGLNLKKGCHRYSLVLFIPLHTSICLFVLFIAIALSAFTTSDYPFGIFKFSHIYYCSVTWDVPKNVSTLVENIGYSRMKTCQLTIANMLSIKNWTKWVIDVYRKVNNVSSMSCWKQINVWWDDDTWFVLHLLSLIFPFITYDLSTGL